MSNLNLSIALGLIPAGTAAAVGGLWDAAGKARQEIPLESNLPGQSHLLTPEFVQRVRELAKESAGTTEFKLSGIAAFLAEFAPDMLSLEVSPDGWNSLGARAMLQSMSISAWTSFESLATDLWVVSVNALPTSLGVNALLARRRADSGALDETDHETKPTPLSLDIPKEYEFDLKNRLGAMIWRKRKFDFNSLEGIRNAYIETFCHRDADGNRRGTPSHVKSWFSGHEYDELRALNRPSEKRKCPNSQEALVFRAKPFGRTFDIRRIYLEAIRHNLARRGGWVDQALIDRLGDDPEWKGIKENERMPLDGLIVRAYTDAVVHRAKLLIDGVGEWLTPANSISSSPPLPSK